MEILVRSEGLEKMEFLYNLGSVLGREGLEIIMCVCVRERNS